MPARRPTPVGAHIFTAGGLARSGLAYAREIGAEAVQVFVSNPRGWHPAPGDRAQDAAFVAGCGESAMPVFVHSPYLVNFASPSTATVEASVAATRHALRRGRAICARGVVA
ncbi:MAG: TIM barrel protein, partial [Mycobacteriales bacterium]